MPFDVDDAAIAWRLIERRPGQEQSAAQAKNANRDLLVAITPRAIVRQYEAIFEQLGYLPGEVTVSTLAGLNLVVDSPDTACGSMLLRSCGSEMTIAVTSHQELRMLRATEYRDEAIDSDGAIQAKSASPSDGAIQAQTASPFGGDSERFRDIYSCAIFFQDTYGGKVERIWHTGFEETAEPLWAQVEAELGVPPKPLAIPGLGEARHSAYLGIFGMLAGTARNV